MLGVNSVCAVCVYAIDLCTLGCFSHGTALQGDLSRDVSLLEEGLYIVLWFVAHRLQVIPAATNSIPISNVERENPDMRTALHSHLKMGEHIVAITSFAD